MSSFSLGVSLVFLPGVALAATTEELAEAIIQEAAIRLGVEISDPALLDSLAADLEFALEEEILDPEIVDELDEALDDGRDPDVDELVDENLEEQEESWREKSPDLLNAFELVKLEFQQCRQQTDGPANLCARGLGFKLQAAATQIALDELDALRLSLDTLTGEEREAAEAEWEAAELRLTERLARAEAKLARVEGQTAGVLALQEATAKGRTSLAQSQGSASRGSQSADQQKSPSNEGESEPVPQPGGDNQDGSSGSSGTAGEKDERPAPGKDKGGNDSRGSGNQGNGKGNSGGGRDG